ncbi:hypothetical protein TNCV_2350771 [Trichonephila clavipes]|uniref:Uncharacterized protein n=1 Tax=Trichonephila clavipes TaxID=2585209 RepID=A0A8X6VQ02_TRICX|nr:hypothetical protein TNCV_2350771 [Trichonephila clavipes]
MLRVNPDAVARPTIVGEEKSLSRVQLISADEMCGEKEASVDVIKETANEDINPVILRKEPVNLDDDDVEKELSERKLKKLSRMTVAKLRQKINLKVSRSYI